MVATLAPIFGAGGAAATLGGLPGALAAGAFTGAAALPYLKNAAGDVARDVLIGRTAPQVALRNVQRKIRRNFTPQERDFTPENELPKAANFARIHMVLHLTVWLACLYWGTLLPALLIGLPRAYGVWFLLCIGLPLIGAPLFTAVYGAMYAMVFSAGHPTRLGQ